MPPIGVQIDGGVGMMGGIGGTGMLIGGLGGRGTVGVVGGGVLVVGGGVVGVGVGAGEEGVGVGCRGVVGCGEGDEPVVLGLRGRLGGEFGVDSEGGDGGLELPPGGDVLDWDGVGDDEPLDVDVLWRALARARWRLPIWLARRVDSSSLRSGGVLPDSTTRATHSS